LTSDSILRIDNGNNVLIVEMWHQCWMSHFRFVCFLFAGLAGCVLRGE